MARYDMIVVPGPRLLQRKLQKWALARWQPGSGLRRALTADTRRHLTLRTTVSDDSVSNVCNVAGYELFGEERATCRGGEWPGDLPLCATNVAK